MPSYQRKEIVPGLFVLAAAAVFALFAFRIGRWEVLAFLKGDRLGCRVVFDEVKTMVVGAKVVVAGRRVGAVHRLSWAERPYAKADIDRLRQRLGNLPEGVSEGKSRLVVEVDFELTDASLRLDPGSASVALQQDGLLGQHYLDLYPGYWQTGQEPPTILAAEHREPLALQTRRTGGLEDLAAAASNAIASVDTLVKTLNEGVLSPANRANLDSLLANLGEAAGELRQLLAADGAVQAGALRSLQALLDSATAALATVREQTLPHTDELLAESRQGVQDFRSALAAVQRDLIGVLDQLEGTLLDTRPELAESVRRLRTTLWQAEMAMRKVRANPALLLFGDDEQDLEAREFDQSGARASGRARIFQQRDERAGGK